ncbi:MAG: phytoene/squalene synthase family protein [Sphingomonadaceae bacterium]|nr:phytoene/squalene synthase family protein [Sphingomonadaceae bacterium]
MDPLVRGAARTIARGSKSFALAARLFEPAVRARALLLYAWCRHCDDVTDGQALGFAAARTDRASGAAVEQLRADTLDALAGRPRAELPFQALARVAAETGMPERWPLAHIDGFALDAAGARYDALEDTLTYCWHVAGAVGVMMALAMGVAPGDRPTLQRACDLGLAFQLANIARDVIDDAAIGRCYLPSSWLAAEGLSPCPATIADPANRPALARVAARLTSEAARYEASARAGAAALSFRSAWAVLAAAAIYGAIGRKVAAAGPRAWDRRQATSTPEKFRLLWRARAEAADRAALAARDPGRAGLWTMPD